MTDDKKQKTIDGWVIFADVILMIAGLIFMYSCFQNKELLSRVSFQKVLNVLVLLVYGFSFASWILTAKQRLSFYGLFLIYMFFSMAGQTLLQFFEPLKTTLDNVYTEYTVLSVNKMLLYQVGFLPAVTLGASLGMRFFRFQKGKRKKLLESALPLEKEQPYINDKVVFFITLILYALLFAYAGIALVRRVGMSYGDYFYSSEGRSSSKMTTYFAIVLSIYLIIRNKKFRRFLYIIIAILCVAYMVTGTRSQAIPWLTVLCVIFICQRGGKVKHWLLVSVGALVLLEIIGAITYLRSASIGELHFSEYLKDGLWTNLKSIVFEMGMSAETATITMAQVGKGFPCDNTILYNAAVAFIPSFFLNIVGIPAPAIESPAVWVTKIAHSEHSGLGYSMLAESFLNYSWQGWIFAFVFIFFVVWIECYLLEHIENGKAFFPAVLSGIYAYLCYFARGQFGYFVTPLRFAFYLFILYCFMTFLSGSRMKEDKRRKISAQKVNF